MDPDARIGGHVQSQLYVWSSIVDIDTVEWPLSGVTIYRSIVHLQRGRWASASHGSAGQQRVASTHATAARADIRGRGGENGKRATLSWLTNGDT